MQSPRKNRTRAVESGVVRYVDHSISIAKQINLILRKLDKNQVYLAEQLGKKESEISKWLRGSHNFTLKTISKIEDVLGESIIICPKDVKTKVLHYFVFSESYQPILLSEKPENTALTTNSFITDSASEYLQMNENCSIYN